MQKNRITLYTNWAVMSPGEEPVFTLEEKDGLHPMTAFLPSGYQAETTADGKQVIKDKYGQPILRFGAQRAVGRPVMVPAPRDGKTPVNAVCELADPRSTMKVLAYRKEDKGRVRWSLDALEGSEAVPVYLPPFCKLIELDRSGRRYIQLPDTEPWEEAIAENGSRYKAPPSPTLLHDFTGIGKDDIPYLEIGRGGGRRKKCHLALPEDFYTTRTDAPSLTLRLKNGRYQTDTLVYDQTTDTAYWTRRTTRYPPKRHDRQYSNNVYRKETSNMP